MKDVKESLKDVKESLTNFIPIFGLIIDISDG